MSKPAAVVRLHAKVTGAAGKTEDQSYCIRKEGQQIIVDTMNADGTIRFRSYYEGLAVLQTLNIERKTKVDYKYSNVVGDIKVLRPNQSYAFDMEIQESGRQLSRMNVAAQTENIRSHVLSGCKFTIMRTSRLNTAAGQPQRKIVFGYAPVFGWPIHSESMVADAKASKPWTVVGKTEIYSISQGESAKKYCPQTLEGS